MSDAKKDTITSLVPTEKSPQFTNRGEILELLTPVLVDQLKLDDAADVKLYASFTDDLGADSLDMVEVVMAIEDALVFKIPDEALQEMKTVGDSVDYIAKVYGLPEEY